MNQGNDRLVVDDQQRSEQVPPAASQLGRQRRGYLGAVDRPLDGFTCDVTTQRDGQRTPSVGATLQSLGITITEITDSEKDRRSQSLWIRGASM